ncbi:MAG: hypothetical protein JSS07_00645 [Proteobacteria bacterium]|nr:hypothetical protein [Pseudomonadota bacterium]
MKGENPKVRSDYHELSSSLPYSPPKIRTEPWFKIAVILALGFVLGIIYSRLPIRVTSEVLAFSTKKETETVAKKTTHKLDKTTGASKA